MISMIPLTKTLHAEDYLILEPELRVVDTHFEAASPQHPQRRWEYAMALRAVSVWGGDGRRTMDVGGAGSPLYLMLEERDFHTVIVDPKVSHALQAAAEAKLTADFVTCISTIEHVEDFFPFLDGLAQVTKPGGVLFLTVDIWDPPVESTRDTAHFHWMRERIFTPKTWRMTAEQLKTKGFRFLGEQDWEYHGNQVYNYSFASIALIKK